MGVQEDGFVLPNVGMSPFDGDEFDEINYQHFVIVDFQ